MIRTYAGPWRFPGLEAADPFACSVHENGRRIVTFEQAQRSDVTNRYLQSALESSGNFNELDY
jgi:hypothetical protein